MTYVPKPEQVVILDTAMRHIRSVPYAVSARWLFYRLLQDGIYSTKSDYHGRFLPLTSKARKGFYGSWRPDTLADDTRGVLLGGGGFFDQSEWLEAIADQEKYTTDKWRNQDYYLEIWFEAKAMLGQFQYYTREIPLLAFGGDISIHPKWDTAKRLERARRSYNHPIVILYFGDDDPKGLSIPLDAVRDICSWSNANFEFKRIALSPGDGERLGIPDNPEKPGTYQWEALDDDQAGEIITDAVSEFYNREALDSDEEFESRVTEEFKQRFQEFVENWEEIE